MPTRVPWWRLASGTAALVILLSSTPGHAQPANDDCTAATVIVALPFTDTVDTTTATTEAGDPLSFCRPGQGTRSVWYSWTAGTVATILHVDASASSYPTESAAYVGGCGAPSEILVNDCNSFATSETFIEVPAGATALIEVTDVGGGAGGSLVLAVEAIPDFLLTQDDAARQHAALAGLPGGPLLAVWGNGDQTALSGRIFTPAGPTLGGEFPITGTVSFGDFEVAAAGTGNFVVVWSDYAAGGDIMAQRLDATGSAVGVPFQVNAYTTGVQNAPAVAADASGNFVVTWADQQRDGDADSVFGRRFNASGSPLGSDFQVNTYTSSHQGYPTIAVDAGGSFVVAWEGFGPGSGYYQGIWARRFDAGGAPQAGEFIVNNYTGYGQYYPVAAAGPQGEFVIAWAGDSATDYSGVSARLFFGDGSPRGNQFQVNTVTGDTQHHASLSMDQESGHFVVAWENDGGSDLDGPIDVAARGFARSGAADGPELMVNTISRDYQYKPAAAVTGHGGFVVSWTDYPGGLNSGGDSPVVARAFPVIGCDAAPRFGCRQSTLPEKSKLLLQDRIDDAGDLVRWTWSKGEAVTPGDLGDPVSDEDYVLCLYDESGIGSELILQSRAPAGGICKTVPCWKATATGFKYVDKDRGPDGLKTLVLKAGELAKAKVTVKGGGENLGGQVPTPPVALPIRIQLQAESGTCWEAVYSAAGVKENAGERFIATAD